ncbi:hypothetical protein HYH03_007754 [Edaphochlamys debaryana]|uniref:Uncharacterized protein n=1 Tax=Edaphochlamys debaryana TaxID=47281 RepID=A0A835Y1H9_9CHLO|nr:hypothetical protein HYH03_007754 [Edaphochlamys debaryana]|eukprot:KAG2494115.1 hypothetical protein HYH03_007754 [Edaphochlamys debaryana]
MMMRAQCVKVQAARPARATSVVCRAQASSRRELLGLGALLAAAALAPASNATTLTEELLAKSTVNKAVNDKKRLATSYANLARSRTVSDGSCKFPENFFGCEELVFGDGVKAIKNDFALECDGKTAKECGSKVTVRSK